MTFFFKWFPSYCSSFLSLFLGLSPIYTKTRLRRCACMKGCFTIHAHTGRRVARIWKRGGAFLKEWEKCKRPWPEFSLFLNQFHTVSPKIEMEFLGKLWSSNVFSAQKQVEKKRSSPKLSLNFRPKSEIQTLFHTESRHPLHDLGGCFQFFTKNRPKKQQKRAILHTSQANGGLEPPRPPWLRYCTQGVVRF